MIVATAASLLLAGSMTALGAVALVQKSRAEAQRSRAEAATVEAISYLDESIATLNRSMIDLANVDLADIPKMVPIRARLLEEGRDGFARLIAKFEEGGRGARGLEPGRIRLGMGRAYRSLGDIERLIGHPEESKRALDRAIKLLGELPADVGELARAHQGRGETSRMLGQVEVSEGHFRKAIELTGTVLEKDPGARTDLAACHYSFARPPRRVHGSGRRMPGRVPEGDRPAPRRTP